MDHLKAINRKAQRIQEHVGAPGAAVPVPEVGPGGGPAAPGVPPGADPGDMDVVGLESGPHIPLGCSLVFAPGWEVDSTGGTAGLCQPVERDLFDCHLACFWPAHVPDQLNHAPDWTGKCAAAQKDWRKIDLIFP